MQVSFVFELVENKTHMCVYLGVFPGISSCKRQEIDMVKSQLSCLDPTQYRM